jgi:hypothetical protein
MPSSTRLRSSRGLDRQYKCNNPLWSTPGLDGLYGQLARPQCRPQSVVEKDEQNPEVVVLPGNSLITAD